MKKVARYIKDRLLGLQSFERLRWRDLCGIRSVLLALIIGAVSGVLAEFFGAERLAQLGTKTGRFEKIVKLYNDLVAILWFPIPSFNEFADRHPGMPVGVLAFGVVILMLKLTPLKKTVSQRFLPDPPAFINAKWETADNDDFVWSGRDKPFVARQNDLDALREFADAANGSQIWTVCGQSGLGKTHLAATWLKQLYSDGWDVGWIDNLDKSQIKDWRPRAHTAIVLDRPSITQEEWHFLASIVEISKASKLRIRLLILAYAPVELPKDFEFVVEQRLRSAFFTNGDGTIRAEHELQPVNTAFVHAYRRALAVPDLSQEEAQRIVSEFEGLTIYVIMKAKDPNCSPRKLIIQRALAALARAENLGGFGSLIAISAIAGPCRLQRRGAAPWKEPHGELRRRLFPWERPRRVPWLTLRESNEFEIPGYVPQAEGDEVLLGYLAKLHLVNSDGSFDQHEADAFLNLAISVGHQQVIDRIVALLNVHPLVEDAWRWKNPAFQTRFRESEKGTDWQTCIAAVLTLDAWLLRLRRDKILLALAQSKRYFAEFVGGQLATPRELLERKWREFNGLWNVGIDDREIGLEAAGAANNAIFAWGTLATAASYRHAATGRMDSTLAYLRGLADKRFQDDREIVLEAANGALSALAEWARIAQAAENSSQRNAAIERVESILPYLRHLADERFPNDHEVGRAAGGGAVNAIAARAIHALEATDPGHRVARIERMESIFAYLVDLADKRFPNDREIALEAAKGANNAISASGEFAQAAADPQQRSMAIERMDSIFAYLFDLTEKRFPNDREVALEAAKGSFNAISAWGNLAQAAADPQQRSMAIERMDSIFAYQFDLAEKRFPNDREVALVFAKSAYNGVLAWGNLAEIASDWRGRNVAMGGMHSVFAHLRDLVEKRFGNDREIVCVAAKGAVATLARQGLAASAEAEERDLAIGRVNSTFAYLCDLADDRFHNDREIGLEAAKGAVNAMAAWGTLALAASGSGLCDAAVGRMDSGLTYLRSLSDQRFFNDREIGLWAATGAHNVILDQGKIANAATNADQRDAAIALMDAAFRYLRALGDERFRNDREIGVMAARGAVEATKAWEKLRNPIARNVCRNWLRELRDRHFHAEISFLASQMNV